jgi:peptide/nickel transport system permease protein
MVAFVVRRLLISIPVMLLASVLVFLLVANSGDPLAELRGRNPPVPRETMELRERELHLDKPLPQRYLLWIGNLAQGDFGVSARTQEKVGPLLMDRMLVTLRMILAATVIAVALAMIVGVLSAVRQYSVGDYLATFTGFVFLSMPVFWLAGLLKEFAGIRINQAFGDQIVYTVGAQSPILPTNFWDRMSDYAGHLVLPTAALVLIQFAGWSRYQRASMLDVLNSDYIRLARAKGLSPRRVMLRHALRTALIPIVTVVAVDFAALFGGAIITERVFAWQGMGALLLTGVQNRDMNIVLGWLMLSGIIVVVFNIIADILYAYLDPRIRHG